jgi:hypothetical protein
MKVMHLNVRSARSHSPPCPSRSEPVLPVDIASAYLRLPVL